MIDSLFQIIAPHYCYGCQEIGALLCDNCKYNITDDHFLGCIMCRKAVGHTGVCDSCRTTYSRAWVVAERMDSIERLLDGYKFERQKAAAKVCAELLDAVIPDLLGADIEIVPIPTIPSHIRYRGYDHMGLVTKCLAKLRKLPCSSLLVRQTNTVQLGASKRDRFANARNAFKVNKELDTEKTYLLVDDVVTTGATLQFAAQALCDAGAGNVWVAAIARQPLDK